MSPTTSTGTPRRLLLTGAPGAGKRTQAAALAARLELAALSTGGLFRVLMTHDTPAAARVRDAVGHGGYVDDGTTNAAFDEEFTTGKYEDGFLLFGYPRTTGQAEHLDQVLAAQQVTLDAVVSLQVGDDELVGRLLTRAEELHRLDDQADTIRPRLALFHETTEPLLNLYRDRGLLLEVDGTGTIDEVTRRIDAALQR